MLVSATSVGVRRELLFWKKRKTKCPLMPEAVAMCRVFMEMEQMGLRHGTRFFRWRRSGVKAAHNPSQISQILEKLGFLPFRPGLFWGRSKRVGSILLWCGR